MPQLDRRDRWEFLVTVHNRPAAESVLKYGFVVLRNDTVIYREQMSHDDPNSAAETAQEQVMALMEAAERYRDEQRGKQDLEAQHPGMSELVEREKGYRGEPSKADIQEALERAGMAVPKEYRDIMANLDQQEFKLASQGIPMKRVYLSDDAYATLVGVMKQAAPTEETKNWWDRNPMGWISRQAPDGSLYHWAKVYRLPDDLQHLSVVATFSDLQERHDLIKIKQRLDSEPDMEKPSMGVDHPAWEFLEQRGIERHEPDPFPSDGRPPAAMPDWNDLLKRDITKTFGEEDDDEDGA